MSPEAIKLAVIGAVLAVAFALGWHIRGWKAEADDARDERIVQKAVDAYHDSEGRAAQKLEDKLASLKGTRTIVEKQIETVRDRPVYRNECLDVDGLRLIETARRGQAPASGASAAVP